ncbi:MAG: isopentenyl-diphosphate Delta-isomerase [Patescibacteria group bacterium]|jgi:protein-tyrosine-phosphatase/8-oxo-dGTP pyrophosphatase MutT (NUDIX family)|nr:isopentenyl-diphosphate Delta-isomerase [Patescibacteria group bacterium]
MELVDVLDSKGNKTGRKATIDEVCDHGYWHHSVHGVIIAKDNKIVAQKRSRKMIMNPGLIEISAGGIVNTGESPDEAIVREIKEELGIDIDSSEVIYINTKTYNKHYPELNKTAKTFLHSYVIKLRNPIGHTKLEASESESIYLLSLKKAKRLVRYHRLLRLGRVTPFYSYWRFSIAQAEKFMHPRLHFVCRGNTFRSRLAEEYWKSQINDTNITHVMSSGIEADQRLNRGISFLAKQLLAKHHLTNHKKSWTQTTQSNIDNSTIVIFMSKTILADADKLFDLSSAKYVAWDIPDVKKNSKDASTEGAENIYQKIVTSIEDFKESELYRNIVN